MSLLDPHEIKKLREEAQIELTELAKITSLSVPQLKQLEEGGDHLFYSNDIKQQAIKRVLKVIDPHRVMDKDTFGNEINPSPSASNEPAQQKNVIDEIVRLSNKGGRAKSILPSPVYTKKNPSAMAWGAGVLFIGIVVLYISPWDSKPQETSSEVVPPTVTEVINVPTKIAAAESSTASIDPLIDSKNAIISGAKSTVDTSLNAVGSTLSRASDVVKSAAPVVPITALTNTNNEAKSPQPGASAASSAPLMLPTSTSATTTSASSPAPKVKAEDSSNPKLASQQTTPSPTTSASIDPCQLLGADAPVAMSPSPSKPGTYVYLTATDKTQACVQDGAGKKTTVSLGKDQGMSVYGKGPWQIASPDFAKFQIFFQGARVVPSDPNGKRIQLVEQATQQ